MRFLAFLSLASKRLRHRAGLSLLLVSSYALTIGMMVCVPIFADAICKQILQEELAIKTQTQNCPTFAVRVYAMPQPSGEMHLEEVAYIKQWLADSLARTTGLAVQLTYMQVESPVYYLQPKPGDTRYNREILGAVQAVLVEDIGKHIRLVAGEPFGDVTSLGQFMVWLERKYADELALQPGETYDLVIPHLRGLKPTPVKVAGIWEALDPQERFWYEDPSRAFAGRLLTTEAQYREFVYPTYAPKTYYNYWYYVLDDAQMSFGRADKYIKALEDVDREVGKRLPSSRMDFSPIRELKQGQQRKASLLAVLFGISLPLVGVLVYFMASVSTMVVRLERQEMAIFSSRGSGRLQVIGLMLVETVLLLIVATPLGFLVGFLLARFMGYSRSFLSFASRAPIQMYLVAIDWRLVGLGMGIAALSRLVPSWSATRYSVVTWERWSARREGVLGVMRLLLVGLLAVATVYAYFRLTRIGSLGLIGLTPSDPSFDPLLLLAPSLFLLTAALIASEIFVLLVRPLALLGKLQPSAFGFLGCMNLGREGGQYRTPIYMLVLCLSVGVFYASLAKSADTWLVDRRRYEYGADLTFQPRDSLEQGGLGMVTSAEPAEVRALQVPLSEYEGIPGVAKAARVAMYWASVPLAQRISNLRLLAIDRLDFPQVSYYRSDYSALPLGELMNRLGSRSDGILLPSYVATQLQLGVGNKLPIRVVVGKDTSAPIEMTIVGTFDYFPTMYRELASVVVANLDYLQTETGGGLPWDIWLRLKPGADTGQILKDVSRTGVTAYAPRDLGRRIQRDQDRLERVGIFGMLSVCFVASAVLASIGLVVYSLAAMMARGFRFAVWQALGMRRSEVIGVVLLEYSVMLLYALASGMAWGVLAAYLYGPYFRLTESVQVPVPPFVPLVDWQRAIWMALLVGVVLILIQGGVLLRVARARVFEVLRMGTRE